VFLAVYSAPFWQLLRDRGPALEWRTARPGDMVKIPADALHGFRNAKLAP
jgi:hypothetical protein